MRTEAILAPIHPETKPQSKALISPYPNFSGPNWSRLEREKIFTAPQTGFSSVGFIDNASVQKVKNSESVKMAVVEIATVEETKKSLSYNPGKRSRAREYVDKDGRRIIRYKRPSRCDGAHDVNEKPCGSPRCRSTNGKDKSFTAAQRPRQNRQRVVIGGRAKLR